MLSMLYSKVARYHSQLTKCPQQEIIKLKCFYYSELMFVHNLRRNSKCIIAELLRCDSYSKLALSQFRLSDIIAKTELLELYLNLSSKFRDSRERHYLMPDTAISASKTLIIYVLSGPVFQIYSSCIIEITVCSTY